jgi:hypothetical protein
VSRDAELRDKTVRREEGLKRRRPSSSPRVGLDKTFRNRIRYPDIASGYPAARPRGCGDNYPKLDGTAAHETPKSLARHGIKRPRPSPSTAPTSVRTSLNNPAEQ